MPRVLITAGPTAEDIDPVRFITNRSSGRMGLALAAAAKRAGCEARLILGATSLEPPTGMDTVRVRSAADMHRAVMDNLAWTDSLVMAAAVADYTPAEPLDVKLKKSNGDLVLRLKRTTDILAAVKDSPHRPGKCIVGFSLDVTVNLAEGRRKLAAKNLDCIVVNSVESFGAAHEHACIVTPDSVEECGAVGKDDLADRILAHIVTFLSQTNYPS